MKSKYIFILFILSIVLVGCDKNQEVLFDLDNEKKEYVDVAISVEWSPEEVYRDGVKIEEEPTKALSYEKECQIDNFWIIKLSGPGYERNIEDFQYIEGSSGIARVTSDINEEKILFILANTNNPNLGLNTNMTGNDLYKLYKSINSNEDAENNEYKNLLMCNDGKLRFDFTTNSVNVKLTRCLAKIEFNFELNTEDITIESVQLKNIDRSLYYLEPILRQRTDRPYKYIDYEKHTDNLPKYKETVTYEWYVPRNTSETRVGGDNNKSATYIEVIAKDKVGTFYKYKVYPGSKLQSSYDIIENRKYIINVKFNGVKDVDSNPNLTEFEILDLKDTLSDCYIINPSTKTKHIRIPVTRVNQLCNDSKYGAIDQTKVFDNSTPWKIDLVWTDNQNIISRTENNKILIEKNYGEGIDDYFEIVVPANFNTYVHMENRSPVAPLRQRMYNSTF